MKKPEYKTAKWEKCAATSIESKEYYINKLDSLRTQYLNGERDEVHYYFIRSSCYQSIAQIYFIEGNFSAFKEHIKYSLDDFLTTQRLLKEGKPTSEATIYNINRHIKSEELGYLAVIISNYDIIPQVTLPDSSLIEMLSGKETEETGDGSISVMERAIVLKDSEMFDAALACRIKEIRKLPTDYYECLDWYSIALVKEAEKAGM